MLCFIGITYPAFTEAPSLYAYKSTGTNDEMLSLSCLNAILAEAINAIQETNCLEMSLSIENIFFFFFWYSVSQNSSAKVLTIKNFHGRKGSFSISF